MMRMAVLSRFAARAIWMLRSFAAREACAISRFRRLSRCAASV
jgi:hypothetical protein